MSSPNPAQRCRSSVLDVFRGLAALLMITNHAGVAFLKDFDGLRSIASWLVFIGSVAPGVFFFATGMAVALASARPGGRSPRAITEKVLVLFMADALLNLLGGRQLGLDFFGIIAVGFMLSSVICLTAHPVRLSIILIILLMAFRFTPMPLWIELTDSSIILQWIAGIHAVESVSYPASPWLVAFLAGTISGLLQRSKMILDGSRKAIFTPILAISLGLVVIQIFRHASFNRWGVVSLAYFALAVVLVWCAWSAASRLVKSTPAAKWFELRGDESFIIVPAHYFLIFATKPMGADVRIDGLTFFGWLFLLCVCSWLAAKGLASVLRSELIVGMIVPLKWLSAACVILALAASASGALDQSRALDGWYFVCLGLIAVWFVPASKREAAAQQVHAV